MRLSRKTLLRLIPAGLGLLLSLGSCTVFATCGIKEDGSWMRCHSAQTTVTIYAAVLSAFLLLPAFIWEKALKIVLNGIGIDGASTDIDYLCGVRPVLWLNTNPSSEGGQM